jgi:hypothetical protein
MRILQAGVLYFAVVFGAGFLLGPIRMLWVVPRLGTRVAELLEAPIMLVITTVEALWIAPWNLEISIKIKLGHYRNLNRPSHLVDGRVHKLCECTPTNKRSAES